MSKVDKECYQCRKMSQWFFTGLSVFFGHEFYVNRPHATWLRLSLHISPAIFFLCGAIYSYSEASKIKAKLLEDNKNNNKYE